MLLLGVTVIFTFIFIDWENIEKSAKQNFNSILNYDAFNKVLREVAVQKGSSVAGIKAFGDFDKGISGLQTKLVTLGIEPVHVVTKTSHEYLKGSADIVQSLDIIKVMYNYPHITDYLLVSGDGDLRHVIKELKLNGKSIRIMGFVDNTSQFIIDMSENFIPLDNYPMILRKIGKTEKEQMLQRLIASKTISIVVERLNREENSDKGFIGLNYFRKRLIDSYASQATDFSDAITDCIEAGVFDIYEVENPNDPKHPTRACKLNRDNQVVKYFLQ